MSTHNGAVNHGVVVVSLIGYVLSLAVRGIEHVVLGWHIRMRETAQART